MFFILSKGSPRNAADTLNNSVFTQMPYLQDSLEYQTPFSFLLVRQTLKIRT